MDNLYSFIYLQCSLMLKKVKIHGVTRLNGKGISLCVQQYEANNIQINEVRNKLKVVVLEGDHMAKKILDISFYDTKPIYTFSTVMHKCLKTL